MDTPEIEASSRASADDAFLVITRTEYLLSDVKAAINIRKVKLRQDNSGTFNHGYSLSPSPSYHQHKFFCHDD